MSGMQGGGPGRLENHLRSRCSCRGGAEFGPVDVVVCRSVGLDTVSGKGVPRL
jgi:hypothetical protein